MCHKGRGPPVTARAPARSAARPPGPSAAANAPAWSAARPPGPGPPAAARSPRAPDLVSLLPLI